MTLIVYPTADKAGSFGEKQVLTTADGELLHLAVLGTDEGDAALKEFSLKASKRGARQDVADDEEDEDEDM